MLDDGCVGGRRAVQSKELLRDEPNALRLRRLRVLRRAHARCTHAHSAHALCGRRPTICRLPGRIARRLVRQRLGRATALVVEQASRAPPDANQVLPLLRLLPLLTPRLSELGQRLPGWSLLAAEQPHPVPDDAHTLSRADWLYANSNVLIHHLIGNGRILTDRQWRALFAQGGLKQVQIKKMDFLGYQTYAYRFPLL